MIKHLKLIPFYIVCTASAYMWLFGLVNYGH